MNIEKTLLDLDGQNSILIATKIENLQSTANKIVKFFTKSKLPGVYVTFNKPYAGIKRILEKEKISTKKIFFIDCITSSIASAEKEENVLHIQHPSDLTGLSIAITEFTESIKNDKYLIIDALATLLIYNKEDLVVKFIKSVTEESAKTGLKTVVLTPETKTGDLLNKIALFFDKMVTG
ncbi:hypothetical protein KY361_04345 [Candidatus Woesearchaeota archaeon]|nr:hypothetical protein [Candidatus Woesearchaeota archaeon]